MKTIIITYFKPSGKYYTEETIEISEDTPCYDISSSVKPLLKLKDMIAVITDSDDGKKPCIVPHLILNTIKCGLKI
ncbi:MAG TPA: hypothetical protein VIK86_04750 [Candidatus Paceibacterota bacterium]